MQPPKSPEVLGRPEAGPNNIVSFEQAAECASALSVLAPGNQEAYRQHFLDMPQYLKSDMELINGHLAPGYRQGSLPDRQKSLKEDLDIFSNRAECLRWENEFDLYASSKFLTSIMPDREVRQQVSRTGLSRMFDNAYTVLLATFERSELEANSTQFDSNSLVAKERAQSLVELGDPAKMADIAGITA